ncbi:hypothetical protein LOZ80_26135 [Paenibacillus sp. HWE-109]|nr:hypothetical protein [Paenibacillus sp. HWE-109]UKS25060.1 hypothetical protein LOZ80_26135 [Paenibacillus sp. HWE-109]
MATTGELRRKLDNTINMDIILNAGLAFSVHLVFFKLLGARNKTMTNDTKFIRYILTPVLAMYGIDDKRMTVTTAHKSSDLKWNPPEKNLNTINAYIAVTVSVKSPKKYPIIKHGKTAKNRFITTLSANNKTS